MFNQDFYPTPTKLIEQLLSPLKSYYRNDISGCILEPSAGKGDIVNYILENGTKENIEIHALEIEDELRASLSSIEDDKFAVIGSDFLTFEFYDNYDYIVMNPPFSNGADHLLKAIQISQQTEIYCILNAETIKNPYTEKRKELVRLIEQYKKSDVEYVSDAFVDAERKTKVEVALIRLKIVKETNQFNFDFVEEDDIDFEGKEDYIKGDAIALDDFITNAQIRAEKLKVAYEEYLRAEAKFKHYKKEFFKDIDTSKHFDSVTPMTMEGGSDVLRYDYFKKRLRSEMWSWVATKMNITTYMSSKSLDKFKRFINKQKKIAFNKENVFNLFSMVMQNRVPIMNQAILDTFDRVTGYEENKWLCWKTNDAFKCNRKIISPWGIEYGKYCSASDLKLYGSRFSTSYGTYHSSYFADLDKILAYIEGRSLTRFNPETKKEEDNYISIEDALKRKFEQLGTVRTGDKYDSTCESTYFHIKFYKKGTIHLQFKDEDLWKEFNYRACREKMWLPEDEKKTHKTKYEEKVKGFTNADMVRLLNS